MSSALPSAVDSGSNDSAEFLRKKFNTGLELDAICTGVNTSFFPVNITVQKEIYDALNITARTLPSGSGRKMREKTILNEDKDLPIFEYSPHNTHFVNRFEKYSELHANDNTPRAFAEVDMKDIGSLQEAQKTRLMQVKPVQRLELMRKIRPPIFARIESNNVEQLEKFFPMMANGDVQGAMLQSSKDVKTFFDIWNEFVAGLEKTALMARPFLGLEGTSDQLTAYMKSSDPRLSVDTLSFVDAPTLEQAIFIQNRRIENLLAHEDPQLLHNPFNNDKKANAIRLAVIAVQGGARRDAISVLLASDQSARNVEVALIENPEQLKAFNPHAILMGGGWHKFQHLLMQLVGLREPISRDMRERINFILMCAGAILGREPDAHAHDIKSTECEDGTAFHMGDYKVHNNVVNTPKDVLTAYHSRSGSTEFEILKQMAFSNAPVFDGVKNMDVISQIYIPGREPSFERNKGPIVGLQSRQRPGENDPVQMAFAFHDEFPIALFLNEVDARMLTTEYEEQRMRHRHQHNKGELNLIRKQSQI